MVSDVVRIFAEDTFTVKSTPVYGILVTEKVAVSSSIPKNDTRRRAPVWVAAAGTGRTDARSNGPCTVFDGSAIGPQLPIVRRQVFARIKSAHRYRQYQRNP
jgi:hypothetical protein